MKVNDFDEVIEVVNDIDYGLIGVVIINNCEYWIKVVNEFDVGNLYFNRGCILVVVGYYLFGGFKMLGMDVKIGSLDYLLYFLE